MKKLLPLLLLIIFGCNNKKDDPKPQKSIKLSIENNSDIPFLAIEIGTGSDATAGKNNWNVKGKGTFDTTITYEIGTPVFLRSWNADDKWVLKITNGSIVKQARYSNFEPGQPYNTTTGYVQNSADHRNDTQLYFGVVRDTIK